MAALTPAGAQDAIRQGDLTISAAWSRATPGGTRVAAGYVKVVNSGTVPDRLVGADAPFADSIEIHVSAMAEGVATMRPLAEGIEIKPGEAVELRPGGAHLMFIGLKEPLREGEMRQVRLRFARSGAVEVAMPVAAVGASGAPHADRGHRH